MSENIHIFLSNHDEAGKAEIMKRLTPERRERIIRAAMPGTPIEGSPSLQEALENADAAFKVEQRPLMAVISGDEAVPVPGKFANVRTDTWAPLGVVGTKYTVGQTLAQLAPVGALVERGEMDLTAIRVKDNGARVQVSGIMGVSEIQNGTHGADVLAHFGTFEASHDGSKSTWGSMSTLRLVCLNGMTSRDMVGKYNIRHTKNADTKIQEAARLVLGLQDDAVAEIAAFQAMAQSRMTRAEFHAFAETLLASIRGEITDVEEQAKAKARRDREIEELETLFSGGTGTHGETLYDGFNAVTEWIDHQKNRKGDIRYDFDSTAFGAANKMKGKARRLLTRGR